MNSLDFICDLIGSVIGIYIKGPTPIFYDSDDNLEYLSKAFWKKLLKGGYP